ncbi:MAG: hypothetical protein OEQ29_10260 [Alphaproteobacteria bacterium]|nr:hypothetical protein [Alphaproteobacteria bacterium]
MAVFGKQIVGIAVAGVLGLTQTVVHAEEAKKEPWLTIVVPIEVQNDGNFKSDDRGNERNDLFATVEPEITVGILPGLTFFAHGVLEPMRDARPGENRFFRSHGIYLEELYLAYEGTLISDGPSALKFRVWGGKFGPNFGTAWDAAPGIYGTDFAEDYEIAERLGFGGALILDHAALGTHTLSASTFVLDRSVLAGSAITKRTRPVLADGGPSNTRGLKSFHVTLEGKKLPGLEGLTYHVSFIHQGVRGAPNERGIAVALGYEGELSGFTIKPIIEYVHIFNADGVSDQGRNYLTTGFSIEKDGWEFALSHTFRHTRTPLAGTVRDNLLAVSGGYTFGNGLGIALGYSFRNEDSIATHTVGVLLTYELSWEFGGKSK